MKARFSLFMILILVACDSHKLITPASPSTTYSIGGTVTGLNGSVVLQDNNSDNLTVAANGAFTFATPIASGSAYSVSVFIQPTNQACTVTNGSGIASGNVANITVYCVTKSVVTTSGNHMLKNGVVWIPHGLITEAFHRSPTYYATTQLKPNSYDSVTLAAYQHFSSAELDAMKAWGADLVRFNVSQAGMDPQNALYSTGFVSTVENAVLYARSIGLNVIVCMFGKDETSPVLLPSDATIRAWNVLAPFFNNDVGVLYEIFNEPGLSPSPENWTAWADAYNSVITSIRATGSTNVVIADGLWASITLNGAPTLTDPLNQLAYAVHPFFYGVGFQKQTSWDNNFGKFAATAPVIVTAWAAGSGINNYCDTETPASSLALLQYLQSKQIGLVGFSYDTFPTYYINSMVTDYNGTPTTFANGIQCGQPGFGAGAIVQDWFRTGIPPTQLK